MPIWPRIRRLRRKWWPKSSGTPIGQKNEPSYQMPRWVAEVILNEELMAEIAPDYDVEMLLEILTGVPVPLAA